MKRVSTILLSLAITLSGCGGCFERQPESDDIVHPFQPPKRDYLLVLAVDTSGSFLGEMFGKDARAYNFGLNAVGRLFHDRMNPDDYVLLVQLSADRNALLWEGTPRRLSQHFGSSDALKEFLVQHSNSGGSNLFAGIAETLKYLHNLPGVKEGETQVCVLVLSDMDDNSPTQAEDKRRMIQARRDVQRDVKGGIGFYFVDPRLLEDTRTCLIDAGLDPRFVEAKIVADPPLPCFVNQP